jgi:GTP-binding protein|tara:strand:- start:175 stop:384 length:210 start_codon:yes stop_codon:yes gene_type:complete
MMLDYCQTRNLALHILLNKSDKISKNMANQTIKKIESKIMAPNLTIQLFSSLKGVGVDDARLRLADWLF